MRGDIDNTQYVRLDGAQSVQQRVVYSVREIPAQRMQTGLVQVQYSYVAVWRPYDPDDSQYDADWKTGTWLNIYRIRVPLDEPGPKANTSTYGWDEIQVDGTAVQLPKVEFALNHDLKKHLADVRA
ncbi:hypothetical protein [Altererythrobacter aquiaggeris]|uniref:hypothetical protein n=1 Tax=Aestuarierythrobacter aquiaggeris TaxID=1898396 RepID=UPI00301B12A2